VCVCVRARARLREFIIVTLKLQDFEIFAATALTWGLLHLCVCVWAFVYPVHISISLVSPVPYTQILYPYT